MADKTYEIEVKTTSDTDGITSVKEALQETKDEADSTKQALEEAFQNATDEVERLEDALMEAEINGDDIQADILADDLAEARDEAERLQEEIDNIDSTPIDDATSSTDEFTTGMENANESTEQFGANLGLLDSAIMMDMASEISSVGNNAESMAQSMEGASITVGQLATATGVAEPQMVSLINHISNATFPQEEAMAYVQALNQMGVNANQLGDSATNMDKINDATHIGYGNVIMLTQGLRSMGVEADNLPSSFNAIAYAQSNVTGGAKTFGQVLKTQAPTINEYGLNVDQVAIMMQKLSERGVQSRKMGSELSKVLKDCNGDISEVEKSLGLQAGTLSHASDETSKYKGKLQEMADEEAEHKTALEQLGAVWEDISLSMSPFLSVGGSIVGILGQIGSTALSINSMVTLYQNFQKWEKLQGIFNGVNGRLSALKGGFSNVASASGKALTSVGNFAKTLGSGVFNAVKIVAGELLTLGKNVLTAGFNALKTVAMWVAHKVVLIADKIITGAVTLAQWALNVAMTMNPIGIVIMAIVALIGVLTYLYFNNEQVREAIDGFGQALMNVGQIIYGYLVEAYNTIITSLQGVWTFLTGLGASFMSYVTNLGMNILNTILAVINFFVTLPIRISLVFTSIISNAVSFVTNFANRLVQGATNMVNNFINKIRELPGMIQEEFNRIASMVSDFVTSLPQRVWDLGASIVQALKSALGIGSPGHMFYMMEGELERIKNVPSTMAYGITKNVSKLGSKITEVFSPTLSLDKIKTSNADSISRNNSNEPNQTINFYFENTVVDDDERMQKIVDYIKKQLAWNNKTAGRTI